MGLNGPEARGGLAVLLCLACVGAAAAGDSKRNDSSRIGSRQVGKGFNLYSPEKEAALGRQLAQEVLRQSKALADTGVAEFVNRTGQNLVRNSDARGPFTFHVLDDDSPNAFALPGGYVFVNTGLIEIAEDEAELAAALAHEIAHVAARHMTRQASRSKLGSLLLAPIGGVAGAAVGQGARAALPLSLLNFSRHDETEADFLGVQYLYATGYDPAAVIAVFEKLESMERRQAGALGRLLATHPPDEERIRRAQEEIDRVLPARAEYVVSTSEYKAVRQRLIAIQNARRDAGDATAPKLQRR